MIGSLDELALNLSEDKDLYNVAISKYDEVLFLTFLIIQLIKKVLFF